MTKGLQKASQEDYKEVADQLEIEEYDIGSNEKLKLIVIDTPSDILLDEIRQNEASSATVFLICFALDDIDSFEQAINYREFAYDFGMSIKHSKESNSTPCILVGTKSD